MGFAVQWYKVKYFLRSQIIMVQNLMHISTKIYVNQIKFVSVSKASQTFLTLKWKSHDYIDISHFLYFFTTQELILAHWVNASNLFATFPSTPFGF